MKNGLQAGTKDLDRSDLRAVQPDFDSIPLIDVADLASLQLSNRQRVAAELGRACEEVGFLYVVNHGISGHTVDAAYGQMKAFFDLPERSKLAMDIRRYRRHRGYVPLGGLNADPHQPGTDIQEAYEIGLEIAPDDPDFLAGNMMYGPNAWPLEPPGFADAIYGYFEDMRTLGERLFRAFALALDLDETWFDDKITKPMAQLRAIHYPAQRNVTDIKAIGIGAHTDYECFTILSQSAAGLQVRNRAGDWIAAPPVPDAFIINIGDMMQRWTNDRFRSTIHRVINLGESARYSLAFFFGADYETIVEVLPTCAGPTNPPRYPPTHAGKWTTDNIKAAYSYVPVEEPR